MAKQAPSYTKTIGCCLLTVAAAVAAAVPGVGHALGIAGAAAETAQDFNVLRSQLEAHGWRVEHLADGDLLLWPPSSPGPQEQLLSTVAARFPAPEGTRIESGDMGKLQAAMEAHGWRADRDSDGSLLLHPPPGRPGSKVLERTAAGADNMTRMQSLLQASGWRVERTATGDLLLWPPAGKTADRASSPAVVQPSKTKTSWIEDRDLEGLRLVLERLGWETNAETDGSLVLRPPAGVTADAATADAEPVGAASGTDDMWHLLKSSGWQVSRTQDGTLLLYPGSAVRESRQLGSSAIDADIDLPVDTWPEARRVAQAWLDTQQGVSWQVGRIRKINWIYLVSIVDRNSPHELRNQLAVRTQDGRVIALF